MKVSFLCTLKKKKKQESRVALKQEKPELLCGKVALLPNNAN